MSAKDVKFSVEARAKMLRGIDFLTAAAKGCCVMRLCLARFSRSGASVMGFPTGPGVVGRFHGAAPHGFASFADKFDHVA
jgi:hypothetical protein